METTKSTRREFCAHAVSFVTLASLLESCGGSPTSPSFDAPLLPVINAGVANNTIVLTIDASSPLAAVGSAALIQASAGVFLVARTAQDTFNAMTAVCTHEGCTITGFQSNTFVCPCHGSNYNTSGSVTRGPAPSSLRRFTANFANDVLTISL